jgi:hypothetical protein
MRSHASDRPKSRSSVPIAPGGTDASPGPRPSAARIAPTNSATELGCGSATISGPFARMGRSNAKTTASETFSTDAKDRGAVRDPKGSGAGSRANRSSVARLPPTPGP